MILTQEQAKSIAVKLYEVYNYNILNYDLAFIQRTLIKFSEEFTCKDYEALETVLLSDETLMHNFFDKLFINVSYMFRDPEVFKIIRENIIPYISSQPIIKIWSAGCATGQEAYSLAIILKELGVYDRSIIYATDIDESAIKKAQDGVYELKDGMEYCENYYLSGGSEKFSKYFDSKDCKMYMKEELKENICFTTSNIITDSSFNSFSLILCRNMFIYFDNTLQSKALHTFRDSLENNSFLVLGSCESLYLNGGTAHFDTYDEKHKIYKLKNQATLDNYLKKKKKKKKKK